jgi:hypothetical protein
MGTLMRDSGQTRSNTRCSWRYRAVALVAVTTPARPSTAFSTIATQVQNAANAAS